MVKKGEEIQTLLVLEDAVQDYCQCFRLKNTDPKAMCEAIIVAVDFCKYILPQCFQLVVYKLVCIQS